MAAKRQAPSRAGSMSKMPAKARVKRKTQAKRRTGTGRPARKSY